MIIKELCIKMKRTFRVQHDAVKYRPFKIMWVDKTFVTAADVKFGEIMWMMIVLCNHIDDHVQSREEFLWCIHSANESIIIICWFIVLLFAFYDESCTVWLSMKNLFRHIKPNRAFYDIIYEFEVSNELWKEWRKGSKISWLIACL